MSPLFQWLSPAGSRARLSTLIFHRVVPEPDPLFPGEVDASRFDAICQWIRRWFHVLPLDEAVQLRAEGRLPSRALGISFDDGYADNHDVALPILARHGLNATFFVATGFLDGGRMWNDTLIELVRRWPSDTMDLSAHQIPGIQALDLSTLEARRQAAASLTLAMKYLPAAARSEQVAAIARRSDVTLPDYLMMTSDQVRALHRAGMRIGAHTVNHPILRTLDDDAARSEITAGRQRLQEIIGAPVRLFAYPNGKPGQDYVERDVALVRACGFDAAFTTQAGYSTATTPAHELPRFTPWRSDRWGFGLQLARNLAGA
ncbi:polysaccharide deacetylase family protein [Rubrivivax albus]|nr:polysaccharide deacetylase family protein [Rubrivivax albus]